MNQRGFSTLWDGYETEAAAKQARDAEAKRLKAAGFIVKRTVLRGQVREYGERTGICNVYFLDYRAPEGRYLSYDRNGHEILVSIPE